MYYDIDSIKMKTGCQPMMKLINCSNSNVNMGKIFFLHILTVVSAWAWRAFMLLTIFSYLYHENNAHTYIYIYRKYYNCCVHNWYFDIVYEDNEQIWADTWHWSWSRDNNDNVSTDNIFSHTRKWHTHFNSSLSKLLELKQIFAHNRHACPDSVLINSSFCSVNISFRRSLHYLVFFNINIDVRPFKIL